MNLNKPTPDSFLDSLLQDIRQEEPDAAVMDAAAARVWARLEGQQPELIQSCADYQTLIPDYLAGRLSEGRALLLADHTHECVACRRALEAARAPRVVPMPAARPKVVAMPYYRWAVAAALLVGAGLGARWMWQQLPAGGPPASVASLDGGLYRFSDGAFVPMTAGAVLDSNKPLRTANGSRAVVRLGDGTLIELAERTEIALSARRGETSIKLDRGNIIVQAAKQHGHLYVNTEDSVVSVTGTVFAVNRGMKGSRVSVIEGEVQVAHNNQKDVLHPGDQVVTNSGLARVPIEQEIAWSADLEKHLSLLRELSVLGKKIEAIPGPGLRYSSTLLPRVPAGSVFYAAIPNLGFTLEEANRLFRERLNESPVLREWWTSKGPGAQGDEQFDHIVRSLADFSKHIGNEMVVYSTATQGSASAPVIMAEVPRPADLRQWLQNEIRANSLPLAIVDSPAGLASVAPKQLPVLLYGNLVAVSPSREALQALASGGGFAATPFYARIADAYRNGAGWLLCVDMEHLLANSVSKDKSAGIDKLGLGDARYVIAEHREASGVTENRAIVSFAGQRRGMASWLGAPASIGALEFVSPDASVVTAFIAKNPQAMLDDLFGFLESTGKGVRSDQARFESATGVNLRADLAGPLSGEVVIAIDGSALPLPEWILAAEVYDSGRLQAAIEKLVAATIEHKTGDKTPLRIEKQTVDGITWYVLQGLPLPVHYTYSNGYLLAGASRPVITRALQNKLNGYTLTRSAAFRSAVPRDGQANFSAMFYQDVAGKLAGVAQTLSPQLRESLGDLAKDAKPTLILAYGEADRIVLASHGSFFGMNLQNMLGSTFNLPKLLQGANAQRN